jgi:uncharacterized protein
MQSNSNMKAFVVQLLKENLSPAYYYHNLQHTLYVADKAIAIGKYEQCTKEEISFLETAALWHDSGFINTYSHHEEAGCKLVKQYLPAYGFSKKDIDSICGMIMATKIPQSPKNKLEEILADADLEYLGTGNAAAKANDLFLELQAINPLLTKNQWNQTQVLFLEQHHYFTAYCKKNKEQLKIAYLQSLIDKSK